MTSTTPAALSDDALPPLPKPWGWYSAALNRGGFHLHRTEPHFSPKPLFTLDQMREYAAAARAPQPIGAQPVEAAPKWPPTPVGSNDAGTDPGSPLVRYGRAAPGSVTLLEEMADGYWTPWHIANELLRAAPVASSPAPVPEGWQLVPIVATREMMTALCGESHDWLLDGFREDWKRTLAAASQAAPVQPAVDARQLHTDGAGRPDSDHLTTRAGEASTGGATSSTPAECDFCEDTGLDPEFPTRATCPVCRGKDGAA